MAALCERSWALPLLVLSCAAAKGLAGALGGRETQSQCRAWVLSAVPIEQASDELLWVFPPDLLLSRRLQEPSLIRKEQLLDTNSSSRALCFVLVNSMQG